MNHIYHSIWNEALGAWVAVSEISKGQGKRSANRRKNPMTANNVGWASPTRECESERWAMPTLLTGLLLCSSPSWALPTGDQLVAGQATVSNPNANVMQIDQSSQKAVVNWQGFSVGQNEAVNINQPNAQAALLNRVVGQDASQIQGKINANGQVYLVNPNGVVFSKTAQVDVGGLVATTHNIKDADFIAGNNHFTQDGAKGTVANHGTINTANGGVVALIGEQVTNTGTINTPKGTTALAAGKTVDLDFKGDGLVEVKVTEAALNAQITNQGALQADGGRVVLTAKAANSLIDSVINQEGVIRAQGMTERNGEIILDGGYVSQTGTLDASGKTGGKIDINARAILDAGKTNADGTAGNGGTINLKASDAIIQTANADTRANGTTQGGTVHLEATNSVFTSGKISATGQQGGTIDVVSSDRVVLAAADVDASGTDQGGLVRIGGDFHGANANLPNAKTTIVNGSTKIKADGGKGKVVIWSDTQTDYDGSISANKAGEIEVSSKGLLNYAGRADAGVGGSLLLDPKNIVIAANAGVANYSLIDPHKAAGNGFGANAVLLTYGNTVVSSPLDSFAASNAGAVYLFNTTTGALLSALTGSQANDNIGLAVDGITALSNGNYVVSSSNWDNGSIINTGAVTWGDGATGISGMVSASNSLVGSTANDAIGNFGVTALQNGNYVVKSPFWDNGAIVNAGAATFGNGATGTVGAVSASNSLVGVSTADNVGTAVTALSSNNYLVSNSNYVVSSSNWSNGTIQNVGAATFGDGTVGITGIITATNSLIGAVAGDTVSNSGITALSNGNYVVTSSNWDNGTIQNVGAATFANGLTGLSGIVTATNSLIGSSVNDFVGNWGATALTNGHYVVRSGSWANGAILSVGAVTWGNGNTGIIGAVSATNSLIGATAGDAVGGGFGVVTALSNGNYVVGSPNWSNGTVLFTGAATWGNGATGISGTINAANSLIGTSLYDFVSRSGITALNNGNYVVGSAGWSNGTLSGAGAATWGNGSTGIIGTISGTNSLIGSAIGDGVSSGGITALTPNDMYSFTGNYVVSSPNWSNGTITNVGAATWGNGDTGIIGTISSTNSLTGSTAFDRVSSGGITTLNDNLSFMFHTLKNTGNYVVSSTNWNNGGNANVGAATWGDGNTGITGIVSTTNSLTGSVAGDFSGSVVTKEVNYGVIDLHNNNYAVHSGSWDNAGLVDAGQVRIVTPQNIYFNNGVGQDMTFNPSTLATTLALGTNIVLQANNDITLDADINVSGNKGGILTLKAGRNITLNGRINTANGNFSAIAGDRNALASDRDAGTPTITLGSGASINTGIGRVILAAIGGNFINNTGSTTPITASRWQVYSTDPRLNQRNGMVADSKQYGQAYGGQVPALHSLMLNVGGGADHWVQSYADTGNWFLYSVTPVLTITPNSQTIAYGANPADITFSISGFLDDDTYDTAGIYGSALFELEQFTGKSGSYNIEYLKGFASRLGYVFADNIASINELTVAALPIIKTPEFNRPLSQPAASPLRQMLSTPITVLQQSTTFLYGYRETLQSDDNSLELIEIENDGLKLTDTVKMHITFPANACASTASTT